MLYGIISDDDDDDFDIVHLFIGKLSDSGWQLVRTQTGFRAEHVDSPHSWVVAFLAQHLVAYLVKSIHKWISNDLHMSYLSVNLSVRCSIQLRTICIFMHTRFFTPTACYSFIPSKCCWQSLFKDSNALCMSEGFVRCKSVGTHPTCMRSVLHIHMLHRMRPQFTSAIYFHPII